MFTVDATVFNFLYTACPSSFCRDSAVFFAEYIPYFVSTLALFIAFYVFRREGNGLFGLHLFTSIITARFLVLPIIRFLIKRPRPFVFDDTVKPFVEALGYSFPSGHATVFFALATSIFLWNKKWGALFLVIAFCISVARIFVGVHYPLDILMGALVGISVPLFISKFIPVK
ncbi:MAG: hypothetical protein RJA61_348 [Candidatus Parcubacteria bacterium]|jgi:undecaprenyl-diphosphatase